MRGCNCKDLLKAKERHEQSILGFPIIFTWSCIMLICFSSDICIVIFLCRTKPLISVMYLTYARFSIVIQSISTDTRASVTAWSVAAGLITIRRYMQLKLRRGCVQKNTCYPITLWTNLPRKARERVLFEPTLNANQGRGMSGTQRP